MMVLDSGLLFGPPCCRNLMRYFRVKQCHYFESWSSWFYHSMCLSSAHHYAVGYSRLRDVVDLHPRLPSACSNLRTEWSKNNLLPVLNYELIVLRWTET